jgi:hypothetical protein
LSPSVVVPETAAMSAMVWLDPVSISSMPR